MDKNIYKMIKYKLDKPLALLFFILSLPFILVFSVIAWYELKTFPFIIQERGLSFDNNRLKIYKFRTMKKHLDQLVVKKSNIFEKHHLEEFVPPFCSWLRKTGLDELPQLLNVIKGEMSLIGPRPLTLDDLEFIEKEDIFSYGKLDKILCKPGITGFWQVFGSRYQGISNLIWLEEYYETNISFLLDIKIFLSTMPLIILGQHSDTIIKGEINWKNSVLINSLNNS